MLSRKPNLTHCGRSFSLPQGSYKNPKAYSPRVLEVRPLAFAQVATPGMLGCWHRVANTLRSPDPQHWVSGSLSSPSLGGLLAVWCRPLPSAISSTPSATRYNPNLVSPAIPHSSELILTIWLLRSKFQVVGIKVHLLLFPVEKRTKLPRTQI